MSGPLETEQQARELPAVQAVHRAFSADPRVGGMAPHLYRMLTGAAAAAGVELGAYDRRVLTWLSGHEPQMCAVIAGLITRAREAGEVGDCTATWPAENDDETELTCWLRPGHGGDHYDPEGGRWWNLDSRGIAHVVNEDQDGAGGAR